MPSRRLPSATLALACLVAASAVQAEDRRDFWSINAGIAWAWDDHMFRDFDGNDIATFASGTWGVGPDFMPEWMGYETELGLTLTDGRWLGEDWSMQHLGSYLTGQWGSERLYLKLRGGVAYNRVKVGSFSGDDFGIAGGAGLGFQILGQPLEVHFNAIDGDVTTITAHWHF
ncbi:outer membrane beta-barrel protein [Gammaproteobacteria bacterium AB-CW1]|uniref:Outer membrane beta-barrel protein n=1 Tax=Natronospira elongata TaxID=3110268 RepID=A0AAP6JGT3_9GAMM|nr:outer membrane beta-barrel protein [Gammaproteobacteria bacterium AB-CW1]